MQWYLKKSEQGEVAGPFTKAQIQHYYQQGKILPEYYISRDKQQWVRVEKLYRSAQTSSSTLSLYSSSSLSLEGTFSHYEIVEKLGSGGMGVVYKARDKRLERDCAIKVLHTFDENNATAVKRFTREAQAMGKLQHPHIINIYEVGESPRHYFAMEYIQGGTLGSWIHEKKLSQEKGLVIFQQMCQAMEYAHQQNIIHRDLKPENIMIDKNEQVKVMDFGLAKHLDSERSLSQSGEVLGTPKYMAPEVADARKGDKRSDIYSLGAILYEILTGRPPFEGETTMEVFYQLAQAEIIAPSRLNPSTRKDIEVICLCCLKKNPQRRYQSVQELREEMDRVLQNKPILTQPPGVLERALLWSRAYPGIAVLLVLTLALAILSSLFFYQTSLALQESEQAKKKEQQALAQKEQALTQSQRQLTLSHVQLLESYLTLFQHETSQRNFIEAAKMLYQAYEILHRPSFQKAKEKQRYLARVYLGFHYTVLPHLPHKVKQQLLEHRASDNLLFTDKMLLSKRGKQVKLWQRESVQESFPPSPDKVWETRGEHVAISPHHGLLAYEKKVGGRKEMVVERISNRQEVFSTPSFPTNYEVQVAFSATGRWLVFYNKETLKICDLQTQKVKTLVLGLREDSVKMSLLLIDFQKDDKLVALKHFTRIFCYNLQGKEVASIATLGRKVSALKVAPNGKMLAYGDTNGHISLFFLETNQKKSFSLHQSTIRDISFSSDNQRLIAGSEAGKMVAWDIASEQVFSTWNIGSRLLRLHSLPNKQGVLVICEKHGKLAYQHWRIEPSYKKTLRPNKTLRKLYGATLRSLQGIGKDTSLDFAYETPITMSFHAQHVAVNYYIYPAVWNTSQQQNMDFPFFMSTRIDKIHLNRSGSHLGTSFADRTLRIWPTNANGKNPIVLDRDLGYVEDFTFAPSDPVIILASQKPEKRHYYRLAFYDYQKQKLLHAQFEEGKRHALVTHQDKLLVGKGDGGIELWRVDWTNPHNSISMDKLFAHSHPYHQRKIVNHLAWSEDGKMFASATTEGDIVLWQESGDNWQAAQQIHFPTTIKNISLSPKGRYLAVFSHNDLYVYDCLYPQIPVKSYLGHLKKGVANLSADWKTLALPTDPKFLGEIELFHFHPESIQRMTAAQLASYLQEHTGVSFENKEKMSGKR